MGHTTSCQLPLFAFQDVCVSMSVQATSLPFADRLLTVRPNRGRYQLKTDMRDT